MILGATTFAEKWRAAMIVLVAGAGMVATALFIMIILITWLAKWSPEVEKARLDILGTGAVAMAILMGFAMIGILVAGPLARIKAKIGDNLIDVEGD